MFGLLKYLKPYYFRIFLIVIFTLLGSLMELYIPTLMANVVDVGIVNNDIPFILQTGGWMVLFSILALLFAVAVTYLSARVALGFSRDVRHQLFTKIEGFSLQEYEQIGAASLITRCTNDVKQIQDVLNMMLRIMTRAPLMLVGGVILAVSRDPQLSLIFLAALPLLAGLIFVISSKAIPLFGELQKRTDSLNLLLREMLTGIRVVRAFNRVDYEKQRFNQANEAYRDTGILVNKIMSFLFPVMLIVMNFTNVAIVWFGAIRVDSGQMQVGNMMAFFQYALLILMSLIMLSMTFVMVPRAQASAKRVNQVLEIEATIKDPDSSYENSSEDGKWEQEALEGTLEFNNVTFRYAGAEKPALKNVSFQARLGETTAIIGSTGAGKTSLVQLIPRFYDVEQGAIYIRGIDVRELTQKRLRSLIGYVPQKTFLFSGTVEENIRFGHEDATEQDMLAALETAQALDFIDEKGSGLATEIEQNGANLSGGQRQRLAIARALVRKPNIYIFDDSFSALDYATDARLRKALKKVIGTSIIILVAQRVNTVIDADQIIVLHEGEIVGKGTHRELLASNQVYQEIVKSQQAGEVSL